MYKDIKTLEEWENIYEQLNELEYQFIIKRNKNVNDFRYRKEFLQNESEKDQIVSKAVQLIRDHQLYDMLIEEDLKERDENDMPLFQANNLKDYYYGSQMYNHSKYYIYSSRVVRKIEAKIKFLSKEE